MSALNYCFNNLLDHVRIQCAEYKKGGIGAIGIFDSDSGITSYSNAAQWNLAIANETAKIVKGIKAEWPVGSPVEEENETACGNDTILVGIDHTITVRDANVNEENDAFWASLNPQRYYIALWLCKSDEIVVIELPVNFFAPAANIPMGNKENQRYNIELKFSAPSDWYPIRTTAPAGIFE